MESGDLVGLPWSELRRRGRLYARNDSPMGTYLLATRHYSDRAWETRAFAVQLMGSLGATEDRAVDFLYHHCGNDPAWQIHEALAMAFDDICYARGYERCLPLIRRWLVAPDPYIRRAVSEGFRPWIAVRRPYFAEDPRRVIDLLGLLRDDNNRSVRESVGNALRDLSRTHFDLVLNAIRDWVEESPDSQPRRTIARVTLKNVVKDNPELRKIYNRRAAIASPEENNHA